MFYCWYIERMISAYIDGELRGIETMRVRTHLRSCGICRSEYDAVLAAKRAVSGMPPHVPGTEFEARLLTVIALRGGRPGARTLQLPIQRPRLAPALSLVMIGLAVALGLLGMGASEPGQPGTLYGGTVPTVNAGFYGAGSFTTWPQTQPAERADIWNWRNDPHGEVNRQDIIRQLTAPGHLEWRPVEASSTAMFP
jgi:hypothetical protein